MSIAATPGLRFRHVLAVALKPGDILSTPAGWATVSERSGIQDGIGGRYIAVTVSLMHEPGATRDMRFDAESVLPVLRRDPAVPAPGTRVRTPFGLDTVVQPAAVPVRFDVAAHQSVHTGLVPVDRIEIIEGGGLTTPGTAGREGSAS